MVVFGEHHQCHPVLMSTPSLRGWHNVVDWVRYSYPLAVGNSAPTPIPHPGLYGRELVCVRNRNPSGGRFCAWASGREKVNPEGGAARSLLKISAEEPQEPGGKAVSRMQRSCFCEDLYTGQGWASSQLSHWRSRGILEGGCSFLLYLATGFLQGRLQVMWGRWLFIQHISPLSWKEYAITIQKGVFILHEKKLQ